MAKLALSIEANIKNKSLSQWLAWWLALLPYMPIQDDFFSSGFHSSDGRRLHGSDLIFWMYLIQVDVVNANETSNSALPRKFSKFHTYTRYECHKREQRIREAKDPVIRSIRGPSAPPWEPPRAFTFCVWHWTSGVACSTRCYWRESLFHCSKDF